MRRVQRADKQRLYGDAVLVFFDEHGGSTVGLLWNPAKATARAMKPFLGYTVKPAPSEVSLATHVTIGLTLGCVGGD